MGLKFTDLLWLVTFHVLKHRSKNILVYFIFTGHLNRSWYWELNVCLNIKICKYACSQIKQIWIIFIHLELVVLSSETQLQVGENINYLI